LGSNCFGRTGLVVNKQKELDTRPSRC